MERSSILGSRTQHNYVRHGLLPADWAGDVDEPMMDFGERRG
jgi:hypothetical protein